MDSCAKSIQSTPPHSQSMDRTHKEMERAEDRRINGHVACSAGSACDSLTTTASSVGLNSGEVLDVDQCINTVFI